MKSLILFLLAFFNCATANYQRYFFNVTSRNKNSDVLCYTCMSRNIPEMSRELLEKSVNMPKDVEGNCDDPFQHSEHDAEPCPSLCIKIVSENKYLKIVMRGCLTSIYKQIPFNDFINDQGEIGSCESRRQESEGIGPVVTDTCLCSTHYCNGVESRKSSLSILLAAISVLLLVCV